MDFINSILQPNNDQKYKTNTKTDLVEPLLGDANNINTTDGVNMEFRPPESPTPQPEQALTMQEMFNQFIQTLNIALTQDVTSSVTIPKQSSDLNQYIITLNKSSNATYLAMCTLVIGIVYIIIMYLSSFIFVPINTITEESSMFSLLLFNPKSSISIFNDFIKTKMHDYAENFSNISENPTVQPILESVNQTITKIKTFLYYWFHRLLLIFYVNKETISITKNRVSLWT